MDICWIWRSIRQPVLAKQCETKTFDKQSGTNIWINSTTQVMNPTGSDSQNPKTHLYTCPSPCIVSKTSHKLSRQQKQHGKCAWNTNLYRRFFFEHLYLQVANHSPFSGGPFSKKELFNSAFSFCHGTGFKSQTLEGLQQHHGHRPTSSLS